MRLFFGVVSAIALTTMACAATPDEPSLATDTGLAVAPPAQAPSGAPYPIVLVHGMAGFASLEAGPIEISYWKGIVEELARHGEAVYVTVAPPFAPSEVRAEAIARQLDRILARTGKRKVNLIGHSQGGLDARLLASPNGLGYGDRIASVTTVSTPHRGSKVADTVLGLTDWIPRDVAEAVTDAALKLLQISLYDIDHDPAILAQTRQLSEKYMREVFNPKYVDDPRVAYRSYAGRSNLRTGLLECGDAEVANEPWKVDLAQPGLLTLASFLEEGQRKVNDGLVTVESAKWGTFVQCVPADHLEEVGHLPVAALTFDHVAFFRDIVARLRAEHF